MRDTQYQPIPKRELSDAQEVHYAKDFKKADISGDFRKSQSAETNRGN